MKEHKFEMMTFFFDYYEPLTVYIVTKLPQIPKELECWLESE